jgi:hypothetical protein
LDVELLELEVLVLDTMELEIVEVVGVEELLEDTPLHVPKRGWQPVPQ